MLLFGNKKPATSNQAEEPWDLDLETGTATWQTPHDIPPLPDRKRSYHAAATLPDGSVIVAGGRSPGLNRRNTTWFWNPLSDPATWTAGPRLQSKRSSFALALCGSMLYAIGGHGSTSLDTIERLDVSPFCGSRRFNLQHWASHTQWTTLSCRLTSARTGCAAVAVFDRYIVVLGGWHNNGDFLNMVDILDTQRNTVQQAPLHMTTARFLFGAALVGRTIFAVGGEDGSNSLGTVECWDNVKEADSPRSISSVNSYIYPSRLRALDTAAAAFRVASGLHLATCRCGFGLAAVGHCLIVAGGRDGNALKSVEVIDTQKGKVWQLPEMDNARFGCTSVVLKDGRLAVFGGAGFDSVETLALVDGRMKLKAMFSSRAELDWNIQQQIQLVEDAKNSSTDTDLDVVKQGAEAEQQLSLLLSLCELEEFKSVKQLSQEIHEEQARLSQCQSLTEQVPIRENITVLKVRLEKEQAAQAKLGDYHPTAYGDNVAVAEGSTSTQPTEEAPKPDENTHKKPVETAPSLVPKFVIQQAFISHAGEHKESADLAGHLLGKLEDKHRIQAFLDSRLGPGVIWRRAIEENAKNCPVFVCFVSPLYFLSFWCLHELDLAVATKRIILPVYLEGAIPRASPSTKKQLSEVFQNKMGHVDEVVVERWCQNLAKLDSIQGLGNDSTHKHRMAGFCDHIAAAVVDNLPN